MSVKPEEAQTSPVTAINGVKPTSVSVTTPASRSFGAVSVTVVTTHGIAAEPLAFVYYGTGPPVAITPTTPTAGYDMVGSDGGVF
ncbi:MAG: hypothetical protein ACLQRM_08710, partial [Acidimicrobiales bacterium]